MSIEIDWETLTTGPEGQALGQSIKEFIHEKFQQVELPRFIRSVHVHAFDFGKECPVVELKDICDPLPEFYERDDDDDDDNEDENDGDEGSEGDDEREPEREQEHGQRHGHDEEHVVEHLRSWTRYPRDEPPPPPPLAKTAMAVAPFSLSSLSSPSPSSSSPSSAPLPTSHNLPPPPPPPRHHHQIAPRPAGPAGLRLNLGFTDHAATTPLSFPRSSTPGIPGGTSNLSYFHLPLSAGLSGTQTPLAAVAGGGTSFATGSWDYFGLSARNRHHPLPTPPPQQKEVYRPAADEHPDPATRPSTATADPTNPWQSAKSKFPPPPPPPPPSQPAQPTPPHHPTSSPPSPTSPTSPSPDPMDTQIVLHIAYDGSVRLSITAEILLDYPMPSFVGIPLHLNITGLTFDGVALIAYLRKRAHFCFLGPDDAQVLVGIPTTCCESSGDDDPDDHDAIKLKGTAAAAEGTTIKPKTPSRPPGGLFGNLLQKIQVESEIGRQEGGKQVLKNVGKVEKFVLEQVRRIFEEEFVWPSFWTVLL